MQKSDVPGFGHIDLRALRFLVRVLEMRSVTGAGEVTGLSQPAASRLLAQLRRAFGDDPLLVKIRGGGYIPTVRATELLPKLRETIASADRLFERPPFDPNTSDRTVRVAATDYGAAVVLTGFAREMAQAAPGMSLDVRLWTPETLRELEEGRLDFALYTDEPLPAGFRRKKLFDERFACLVRHDHPVLKHRDAQGHVSIERLATYPRVILSYIDGAQREIDDPLASFGIQSIKGSFCTPYFLSGPLLLAGSDHVLCVARRIAKLVEGMAGVTVLDVPAVEGFTYCLIWHTRSDDDDGLSWLRQRVKDFQAPEVAA